MPYGLGAKAEVLSILAFRACPVDRGFATGKVEVTETPFPGSCFPQADIEGLHFEREIIQDALN